MKSEMEPERDFVRREERFCVADLQDIQVVVRRMDVEDSKEFYADLIDFSRKGVKLKMTFCVQFEEHLMIRFEFANSDLTYEGVACVRHMRSDAEQTWQVGCSIEPLVPDEIINYLATASGKERRRYPRKTLALDGAVLRQGNLDGSTAELQNFSDGGFCIQVPRSYEIGERIKLRLQNIDGYPETIAARIRWQSEIDDGYRIGCSFADSEGFEKLLLCVPETVLPEGLSREDQVRWYVVAATLLALFLPPLVSLFLQNGSTLVQGAHAESRVPETQQNPSQVPTTPFGTPRNLANNDTSELEGQYDRQPVEQIPPTKEPEQDRIPSEAPAEFPSIDASPQLSNQELENQKLAVSVIVPDSPSPSTESSEPANATVVGDDNSAGDISTSDLSASDDSTIDLSAQTDPLQTEIVASPLQIRVAGPGIPQRLLESNPFAAPTRTSLTHSSRRTATVH
jgi:hypothetical protein